MRMNKIVVPAIVLGAAMTGAILWNTIGVNAATDATTTAATRHDEMAKELATKLNIDESKVSEAMDQVRTEHQATRQAEVSTKLDQAVTDGVITAEQKQKILDKMATNKVENVQGQKKGQNKTEMEQWFKDNGIDSTKIHDYIGMGKGNGNGESRHGSNN